MEDNQTPIMTFSKRNYMIVVIGLAVMLLGCFLMAGGGDAPDLTKTYPEDTLYGFQRTALAPLVVLIGLGIQIFAIFYKDDSAESAE